MSEVKRFDPSSHYQRTGFGGPMQEAPNGLYVLASDYDALLARQGIVSVGASGDSGEVRLLTGLLRAAKSVIAHTEAGHRPPVRDELETGRMVLTRLHALADLHGAVEAILRLYGDSQQLPYYELAPSQLPPSAHRLQSDCPAA